MDEETKKRIAQFRFGVIHDLIGDRKLSRGEKERLLKEKSACQWEIPFSGRSYISRSTILHWLKRYEEGGRRIECLYPDQRTDLGKSRALDQETTLALINLKKEFKGATLPVILRVAKQRKILSPDFKVAQATIYRLFKREGLINPGSIYPDRRRFEAQLPNDLWQSDCLHGPKVEVEGRQRKSYLFAFIDDMSRLIPHAEFYLKENISSYTDALKKSLQKRGLPRKLYVDNGPSFRSDHLGHITASLGIALIHSKPYQPEGRGKIERWFKTVRMQFLSIIPSGLSLSDLNRKLQEWLDKYYHVTIHSSTKQTPLHRYLKNVHLIREAPNNIEDYFRKRTTRRVEKDRSVALLKRIYEAPVELIGKKVSLFYHEDDPQRIEVFYQNKSYGMLTPLDPHVNCRIKREQHITEIEPLPDKQDKKTEQNNYYQGGKLFEKGEEET